MTLELTKPGSFMTVEQIADVVGVSRQAIAKNTRVEDFFIGWYPNPNGTGRPTKGYKPEVLTLWGKSTDQIVDINKKMERKGRDDKGGVRWTSDEKLKQAIDLCKQLYIENAQANLLYACEQAAKMMNTQPGYEEITGKRLHRRLQRNGKNGDFRSEYFQENWEMIRRKKFQAPEHALNAAGSIRYEYWRIMEAAGIAGKGRGACNVIIIDDFKRDAWSVKDGKLEMPEGIAYIDGVSGYPLFLLPAQSINTETVAAGMVMVAYAYNLPEQAVWVMENSKTMKNVNIEMLARSMYTDRELYDFEHGNISWVKEVFYGQCGPVVRSLPHIPKHAFKAKIERFFKIIKDEFDATRFPRNYQGGSRQEATKLTLAGQPMIVGQETKDLPSQFYTVEYTEYWQKLYDWLYSDCIMRNRPVMLNEWAKDKSLECGERLSPTIHSIWNYYKDDTYKREIEPEKIAYLLYWANPERHLPKNLWTVRKNLYIEPIIKGRHLNLFSEKLTEGVINQKVATVPIPGNDNQFLIFIANDPNRPEFLCIADDFTAKDSKSIPIMRSRTQKAREDINSRLNAQALPGHVWENQHELIDEPKTAPEWAQQLADPDNNILLNSKETATEQPETISLTSAKWSENETKTVEISDDMADILSELNTLLGD